MKHPVSKLENFREQSDDSHSYYFFTHPRNLSLENPILRTDLSGAVFSALNMSMYTDWLFVVVVVENVLNRILMIYGT